MFLCCVCKQGYVLQPASSNDRGDDDDDDDDDDEGEGATVFRMHAPQTRFLEPSNRSVQPHSSRG